MVPVYMYELLETSNSAEVFEKGPTLPGCMEDRKHNAMKAASPARETRFCGVSMAIVKTIMRTTPTNDSKYRTLKDERKNTSDSCK